MSDRDLASDTDELIHELADRTVNPTGYADDEMENERRAAERDRLEGVIRRIVGVDVYMTGVAVEYVTGDIQESGYVAHALLSDGTRSWPMGARVYPTSGPAERECLMIRWRNGGPQIERED